MTLVFYSVSVSPHVIPFVEEVRRQRPDITIKYIVRGFTGLRPVERNSPKKGWDDFCKADYLMQAADDWTETRRLLKECDVLFCGFRETETFEEQVNAGFFFEYMLADRQELFSVITEKFQTITQFGVNAAELARQVTVAHLRGIDRIMPIENAMDIGVYLNGHDLIRTLSRVARVHDR